MLSLLSLLISSSLAFATDLSLLKSRVDQFGCQAAMASDDSTSLVCFRDDVVDQGLPTETRGCSVRLYDVISKKMIGYQDGRPLDSNQVLIVPMSCQNGGFEAILQWPVDESSTLETYLRRAYEQSGYVFDLSRDSSGAISNLIAEIRAASRKSLGSLESSRQLPPGARAAAPVQTPGPKKHATVRVFFGSDRQYVQGQPPPQAFANTRAKDSHVSLGVTDVSIPVNHKYGNLELPSVFKVQFTPDPDRYVVVKSVARLNPNDFYKLLNQRVQKSVKKDLFVFVHGYNTSFEEAAQRTAQIAFDLKFPGAPVFYSWPAETLLRYAIAEKNVEWSLPHVTSFLQDVAKKSGASEIHLIAHSMGNRALTNALNALALKKSLKPKTFQNVILAAPDVDQNLFRRIESNIRSMTKTLTLYASNNDKALQISARIHSVPRLGQAGDDTLTLAGMDTVDATAVDSSLLGHSYFGDNRSVVDDIAKLVMFSMPVHDRSLDAQKTQAGGLFWQIPLTPPMIRVSQ